jgi:CRISPR-associated endonuclease/helicase Cas3
MKASYFKYWGKAKPPIASEETYHLLPYHSLDVAAVGQVLLQREHPYLRHLLRLTDLSEPQFIQWFTFLLALHDIGKFADSFQSLNADVLGKLQQRTSQRQYGLRHDSLGWILWKKHLSQYFKEKGMISPGTKRRPSTANESLDVWMGAMVGHHGQPPQPSTTRLLRDDFDEDNDFAAAATFVADLIPILFDESPVFPACRTEAIQWASWWLSGLAVLSDWLGSNTDFFPYQSQAMPLDQYWEQAKQRAERAIQQAELLSCHPSNALTLADLIEVEPQTVPAPTPLQEMVSAWELPASPHLFILEDVTGAGKTEAAVLLAHRLMQAGQGNSVYFALPTMATANTMYSRMKDVYRRLFAGGKSPSLILAHGASEMSADFRRSLLPEVPATADHYGDGTTSAGAHCNAWLADNRKKALLADIGIGTVDQALLAILPARHQSLRLLGLMHKILLVDEVHACDAYMHELLCALLRAHATAGGSVILLSATLPKKQRQALLQAYAEGQRWSKPALQATDDQSYPLMSCLNAQGLREQVVATRASVKREVSVQFLSERQAVEDLLSRTLEQGQCACWIRNTVKDAIEAYQQIKARHPDWQVDLFHARYALGDRIAIEKRVVARFDKNSTAESRRGQILIATQVVEQSLDLDFDTLITDLAPIDLLIQRAGRLRRHTRDALGNRIQGDDQRGAVTLHIHSPVVTDAPPARWIADFFPNAQKVYDHHGQLWLTARRLQRQGKFQMPEDARTLMEGVYGDEAQDDIPEGLRRASNEAEGGDRAEASLARLSALSMEVGYTDASTNRWWDEAKTPTRLGEETTMVYLAKWQDGVLLPWADSQDHEWPLSAVSMRTYWIATEAAIPGLSQAELDQFKVSQLPAKGKWGVLLPLQPVADGRWQGTAQNAKQESVSFVYSEQFGLMADVELVTKETKYESD